MDNSNNQSSNNRQIDHLGVNKIGKNIKKSPLHQPNFPSSAANRQQPQPQVYNINKNDFRNIVQQLTGSPSRDPPPRPPQNNPKPPNHRLQRVRPPPLAPTNRPQVHMRPHYPVPVPQQGQHMAPQPNYPNNFARPPHGPHYDQQAPAMLPSTPTDIWANTNESPISAYMRYLQNSIIDSGPRQPQPGLHPQFPGQNNGQPQPGFHPQFPGQNNGQPHLIHNPAMPPQPSPRMNGPYQNLPSPRMNGPPSPLLSPRVNGPHSSFPSPRMTGQPPLLPSPTSQYLLPSPSFFNMSPRGPYPLLSPGYQHAGPISPNFSFAAAGQSGILGPGPHPPPSPGYGFPLSPGFFHIPSPRWSNQGS